MTAFVLLKEVSLPPSIDYLFITGNPSYKQQETKYIFLEVRNSRKVRPISLSLSVLPSTYSANSQVHCHVGPIQGSTYRQSDAPFYTPACKLCSTQTFEESKFKRTVTTSITLIHISSVTNCTHTSYLLYIFQPLSVVLVENEANIVRCILITSNSFNILCPHTLWWICIQASQRWVILFCNQVWF